ncbi:MopE-related protein [Myxococcota bacterium]
MTVRTLALLSSALLVPAAAAANPVILYTDILSGPSTGGEGNHGAYLSIFGKGFGATRGSSSVTIGGVEVADYVQWGALSRVHDSHGVLQISVRIGAAIAGTRQPIVVTVDGVESNDDHTFSVVAGATVYYVSPTGDNSNDGSSLASAKATPGSTVSLMNPGDQTIVTGGTYDIDTERVVFLKHDEGTPEHNFAWTGMPGETPLFDSSYGGQTLVHMSSEGTSRGYVTVSNLVHDGHGSRQVSGSGYYYNSRFVNMETWGMRGTSGGTGAWGHFRQDVKIFGNSIHDQGCNKLYHNIYLSSGAIDVEIGWNHIYNNFDYCGGDSEPGGRGIQAYDGDWETEEVTNLAIHDNVLHDISRECITLSTVVRSATVYNNVFYRCGLVTGFGLRSKARYATRFEVYNNTFYANGSGHFACNHSGSASDLYVVKNNLFYSTDGEAYYESTKSDGQDPNAFDASHNLFWGNGGIPPWSASSVNADPQIVDPTEPARNFYLEATSPAIDSGVDVGVTHDPDGRSRPMDGDGDGVAAADIGAFEFDGAYIPPPCADMDGDGYGSSATGCSNPEADCNDDNPAVHPEVPEICNNTDDDCKGGIDDGPSLCPGDDECVNGICQPPPATTCTDADGDGYGDPPSMACSHSEFDCDDSRADVNPGASEDCDNIDNDCNGQTDNVDGLCPNEECLAGVCQPAGTESAGVDDGGDNDTDGHQPEPIVSVAGCTQTHASGPATGALLVGIACVISRRRQRALCP